MAIPRRELVDPDTPGVYHCISRCVRRAALCGEGYEHRMRFLYDQLKFLTTIFAIDVIGFSLMDNHMHTLLWTDPDRARAWSSREVARRWLTLCPRSRPSGRSMTASVDELAQDAARVDVLRSRLASLSWYMKYLKEPLARMANLQDGVTGHFWEGRFKSIRVVDHDGIITCMAYIDLNPIRAGKAETPEKSTYTSIKERIDAIVDHHAGMTAAKTKTSSSRKRSTARSSRRHRQPAWLIPLGTSARRAIDMTIESYLELVDALGRIVRGDKRGSIPVRLRPILERLGLDAGRVSASMRRLTQRLRGTTVGDRNARAIEASRRRRQRVVMPL